MSSHIFKQHITSLLVILLFVLFATRPLYAQPELYSAHDIWHQVARLYHYSQAVSEGSFPPAWIGNLANGYGYPLFIFSYHFPWLLGTPLVLLGLSVFSTIKILFFTAYLLAGIGMYVLIWQQTKQRLVAVIAAVGYLFAPYHFLTLYVSAAIGTAFSFAVLPYIFLALQLIFSQKYTKGLVLLALAISIAILSHLMTFIYILALIFLYLLYSQLYHSLFIAHSFKFQAKEVGYSFGGLALGFLLAGFYIVPLFTNYPFIQAQGGAAGFGELYKSNFVSLKQLVYSPWGFGPIISNAKDGEISFQVGIAQWLAALSACGAFLLYWMKKIRFATFSSVLFLFLGFSLSILGMLEYTDFLWDFATRYISLDYPFRLLLVTVFCGSALIGHVLFLIKDKRIQALAGCLFLVVLVYTNRNHIRVNMYTEYPLELYVASETTTNTFHEYMPKGASGELLSIVKPIVATGPNLQVLSAKQTATELHIELDLAEDQEVVLQQLDYPGQTVLVNAQPVAHTKNDKGQMQVALSSGIQQVSVIFTPQPAMQAGKILSILTMLCLLYIWRSGNDITKKASKE